MRVEKDGVSAETMDAKHARKRVLDLLALASPQELQAAWDRLEDKPDYTLLRPPQCGLIMVRGQIGGGGAVFNLGEATMTRATLKLACGTIGHGYRLGTDMAATEKSAIFDGLAQRPQTLGFVEQVLLQPIARRIAQERLKRAQETAATKVDFFTMVRGED